MRLKLFNFIHCLFKGISVKFPLRPVSGLRCIMINPNKSFDLRTLVRGGGGGGGGHGGGRGNGWGFDRGIHLLSGRFDRVPLLGGWDICFVGQRDWGQDEAWLPGIVFLVFGMAWVSEKVSFFTDIYLLLHRPSSLKNAVFRTFLLWSV